MNTANSITGEQTVFSADDKCFPIVTSTTEITRKVESGKDANS